MDINKIYVGDALEVLKTFPNECIDTVITSPPYWGLRDYGVEGQLGHEKDFRDYIDNLCNIFDEVKRVLKSTGSCWVNMGDVYGGTGSKKECRDPKYPNGRNGQALSISQKYPSKCLLQIPSRFAIEMCDRGWILRNEIIWHKPNAMPSSVKDRFTVDYEKMFFFTKSKKYYFKQQKEPMKTKDINPPRGSKATLGPLNAGRRKQDLINRHDYIGFNERYKNNVPKDLLRNKRCVWDITTKPFKGEHFAVFPPELVEIPLLSTCPAGGVALDPFIGSGTLGKVALSHNLNYVGIELNGNYANMANKRINNVCCQLQLDI